MALEALLRGWISRGLPQPSSDNTPGLVRLSRYGEAVTLNLARKQHLLADEGAYFVANNSGAGIATAAAPTTFSDIAPLFTIFNTDTPGNTTSKRIYLDVMRLILTAAGTAGTDFQIQVKIDNANRFSSGGTQLTPVNVNMDVPKSASIADIRFLPVATAASVSARVIIGMATLLNKFTANGVVGMSAIANFGGVEGVTSQSTTSGSSPAVPPVIVGPGQCVLINFQILSQSAATSWTPELSWWER